RYRNVTGVQTCALPILSVLPKAARKIPRGTKRRKSPRVRKPKLSRHDEVTRRGVYKHGPRDERRKIPVGKEARVVALAHAEDVEIGRASCRATVAYMIR